MLRRISQARWIQAVLALLHGAMLSMIIVLAMMSNYEDDVYDQLVRKLTTSEMSQQEIALSLLHGTHSLLKPRQALFLGDNYNNIRDSLFRSADIQLIDARENCGSYAHVLGRLLQRAGLEVRLLQMKCGETWACHILLEAKVDGRFVVLDALFDLAFVRPDGKLASFSEVGSDWSAYRVQVPEYYNQKYAYEDARYTNWEKIPFLMPGAKHVLTFFMGKDIDTLSIRSKILNIYKTFLVIFLIVYLLLSLFSIYVVILQKKRLN